MIDFFIFIVLSLENGGDATHATNLISLSSYLSRESGGVAMRRTNPDSLRSCLCFQVFRLNFFLISSICCLPDSTKQK